MPYKLRSDHPGCTGVAVVRSDTGAIVKCHPDRGKALAHLRALYANVADAAAIPAGYVPGGPRPVVIEHHPGCPPSHPHGITDGPGGHLLACHATPAEAKAIAEKLDLAEPSGTGDSSTAAAFNPAEPRGHGGKWVTWYHGVDRENGRRIEREGLRHGITQPGHRDYFKLTTDKDEARGWAGRDGAIVHLRLTPDQQAEYLTAPTGNMGMLGPARLSGIKKPIPPSMIHKVEYLDGPAAAARGGFDPARHPRIEHGHGGGEFTHAPGGGGTTGHLHDGIADPPPSAALTFDGRFTLRDLPPGDKFLVKINAKLTRPLIGTGPNKGKVRRPAVPPYAESVARVSAAMTQLIAQQGTLEDGKKWYPDEHAMNHRRAQAYHVPIETAIGVEAATCPRVQWLVNQRVTNELLDEVPKVGRTAEEIKRSHHFGGGVMSSFRDEGVDIILGADVDKELGGTKRRNFYNNIMWPGQTDSVTVDTWMLQALKPLGLNDDQALALGSQAQVGLADGIGKVIVADALRAAADRYRAQGTDITPDGVQAAAWIAIQKQLGLSDPSAHTNPRDVAYMHAAAPAGPDPDDEGGGLSDDQWDAELLIQYLTWLAEEVPGGHDLGSPGSARSAGGLAADNLAAWKIVLADPRFGRLGMTPAQARQAARGPATPMAAAGRAAGPYTVAENHPACPAGKPHATVHAGTGDVAGCHRTAKQAQDLALTLNFPDATPVTPGAVMVAGAAEGKFRGDLHPRRPDGKFAPKGQGGSRRPRAPGQVPRQPATAPVRRMGEGRPAGPPGTGAVTAQPAMAAAIAKDRSTLDAAAVERRITAQVHAQMNDAIAGIERTHAQLAQAERAEQKTEEHHKIVRRLFHHLFALAGVVLVGFINHKLGTPDVLSGLTEASPLFIQEGLDFIKRV